MTLTSLSSDNGVMRTWANESVSGNFNDLGTTNRVAPIELVSSATSPWSNLHD